MAKEPATITLSDSLLCGIPVWRLAEALARPPESRAIRLDNRYTVSMTSSAHFRPVPVNTFRCPLCGSTAYDYVYVMRSDKSIVQTQAYECGGCSVVFKDPKKFTEQRQVEGFQQWGLPPRPKNP